ncbi:MAG: hypothetical protein E7527_02130 [Ruminococcaceae bacterium]|nr:hypothetical protein [Oscillospiraceae bacterium]
MKPNQPPVSPTEGTLREQLATYFLSQPPLPQLSVPERKRYMEKLTQLGQLERQEFLLAGGAGRPMVWGNPAPLLQAFLSAAQRLAAGLGQPLLLFPAKDTSIGTDTLLHPRLLSVTLAGLLRDACLVCPRQPVWVRLQERLGGLAVAVTAPEPFITPELLALTKECTRLHEGSLVHCDNTVLFTCGQVVKPPAGIRLYGCPTEEDLLQDSVSPVWSGFYAGIYSVMMSEASSSSEEDIIKSSPANSSSGSSISST